MYYRTEPGLIVVKITDICYGTAVPLLNKGNMNHKWLAHKLSDLSPRVGLRPRDLK
jgi:hypothetical protein